MNYIVTAYRWGDINEQFPLFSSQCEADCIKVAEHYPEWRGGKYGCAVMSVPNSIQKAMEGDCDMQIIHYFSSMLGESRPTYTHRYDTFNAPICEIIHHKEYANAPNWIKDIISKAEETADRRNETEKSR